MVQHNPFKPGPLHWPKHIHVARWIGIALFTPVALTGAVATFLLWKLDAGPLDITAVSRWVEPISVVSGKHPGFPAGRLTWKKLKIEWQPSSGSISAGLMLEAHHLMVERLDGTIAEQAGEADTVLALAPLLHGVIAPRRLRMRDASIVLRRQKNGEIELDLPFQRHSGHGMPTDLGRLADLDINNVSLTLLGLPNKQVAFLGPIEAHAQNLPVSSHSENYLWNGWWRAGLKLGGFHTILTANGGQNNSGRGVWNIASTTNDLSGLDDVVPALQKWHIRADTDLILTVLPYGMQNKLSDIVLNTTLKDGTIIQKSAPDIHVHRGSVTIHLHMNTPGVTGGAWIDVSKANLVVADHRGAETHVGGAAHLTVNNLVHLRSMDIDARAGLDQFDFATLGDIWPASLVKGARRWSVENITQGRGGPMRVHVHAQTNSGINNIRLTQLDGELLGHDLTVHGLRPLPPFTGAEAILKIADLNGLSILLQHAEQQTAHGLIKLPDGDVRIENLFGKTQIGIIRLHLTGSVPAFNDILSAPRLHLLSRHPLPFTKPSGLLDVNNEISLPLSSHVQNQDIHVHTQAVFSQVHLGNVVLGRPLDQASGHLSATEKGMTVWGEGLLSGVPVHAIVEENFSKGAPSQIMQNIRATARVDPQSAAKARLGIESLFKGQAEFSGQYIQRANARADLQVTADLQSAKLVSPLWVKPQGEKANISGHMVFQGHTVVALKELQAHGRELNVLGEGELQQGRLAAIDVNNFQIGRNLGTAHIVLPHMMGDPYRVEINAQQVDLAPVFDQSTRKALYRSEEAEEAKLSTPRKRDKNKHQPDWRVSVQTPRVYYGPKAFVSDVVSDADFHQGRLLWGQLDWSAPSRVHMTLDHIQNSQPFKADTDNLGALLQGLGLYSHLKGGETHLVGRFVKDERGEAGLVFGLPTFEGHLSIKPFQYLHPPFSVTMAANLSPLHWFHSHTDHFDVQHTSMDMTVSKGVLTLKNGSVSNDALGGTVEGPITLKDAGLNLKGTIVPLFGLNAWPRKIPLVGHFLAPEKGGGVFSATYRVRGTLGEPDLSVNPFSLLLPGVLRKMVQ
ncbi:YhdP family protein [Swingsia samuiensis]|uniref:AsmA-like C-terminal domain-containing protein n=1 Tax=Swingsia samuiensis TaxID=1293412 RepID=A0A4Y6UKE5_9PROT|nr:AsmA-like C-terminal region-containing protein [Swingsia samuiensis]QDH17270.1 hypothetical protein E3D00_06635 [Swingsia samuiensis]